VCVILDIGQLFSSFLVLSEEEMASIYRWKE
jgi:hypothetical protein